MRATAVLAALLLATSAMAQSAEDRATARLLTQQADQKLGEKDYRSAIDLFSRAYALVNAPTIKLALGRARVAVGQLVEAQSDFFDASRSTPVAGEPASWGAARDTARAEANTLTVRIPTVEITTDGPANTVVFVDAEQLNPALIGVPRAVNPGAHVLRADAAGFVRAVQNVTLSEGEHQRVTLHLAPAVVAASPVPVAPPPAPVPAPAPLPTSAVPVLVEPAPVTESTPPSAAESSGESGSALKTAGYVGAAVFGAAWVTTGIWSIVDVKNIESQCHGNDCPAVLESQATTAKALGTVATVCLPLALVSLGVGLFAPGSNKPSTSTASLSVGARSVELRGAF